MDNDGKERNVFAICFCFPKFCKFSQACHYVYSKVKFLKNLAMIIPLCP